SDGPGAMDPFLQDRECRTESVGPRVSDRGAASRSPSVAAGERAEVAAALVHPGEAGTPYLGVLVRAVEEALDGGAEPERRGEALVAGRVLGGLVAAPVDVQVGLVDGEALGGVPGA